MESKRESGSPIGSAGDEPSMSLSDWVLTHTGPTPTSLFLSLTHTHTHTHACQTERVSNIQYCAKVLGRCEKML